MRDDLKAAAQAWAEELLPGPRWRLEPTSEAQRRHRATGRASYRARFRAWEPAGTARVLVGAAGSVATFPFDADVGGADGLSPPVAREELGPGGPIIVECALGEARRQILQDPLEVRSVAWRRVRGELDVRVALERARPDAEVVIDLDAATGERLGMFVAPLLRGSRRSVALSRRAALERARAQAGDLSAHARLVRARLARGDGARVWRVHWDDGATGVALGLNARTGRLVAWERTLVSGARDRVVPTREEAAAELALAIALRLGRDVRTSAPVAGARDGRPVWFAVAHTGDGRLFRATLDRGRVDLVRRDAAASSA